ncbi:hypothetical protein [Arthrobacter sp. B1805]|uniref:hypothetical protein n=1 Tax=Arthrobacter sp. B1805 TaxID=2058892 RepID=UPI0011B069D1|nr:hypothetical protein [Arthrobacter sp. B1805]
MTTRDGHCAPCKRARQTALIESDRLALAAAQEEALAEAEERERLAAEAARKAQEVESLRQAEEAAAALVERKRPDCSEHGCTTEALTRGLCSKHYRAFRRNQSGDRPMPGPDGLTPALRQAQQSLEAYWAARRRRGVPPEGIGHEPLAEAG